MKLDRKRLPSLLFSILLAEAVGGLSALLSGDIRSVYQSLNQPPLAPPGWLFPVVWVILFALMGLAAYQIWADAWAKPEDKGRALFLYAAQLLVNFLWPIVFFRWERLGFAAWVILLLDVLVVLTFAAFRRVQPGAALLLIPYLLWLLFATYLNIAIVLIN